MSSNLFRIIYLSIELLWLIITSSELPFIISVYISWKILKKVVSKTKNNQTATVDGQSYPYHLLDEYGKINVQISTVNQAHGVIQNLNNYLKNVIVFLPVDHPLRAKYITEFRNNESKEIKGHVANLKSTANENSQSGFSSCNSSPLRTGLKSNHSTPNAREKEGLAGAVPSPFLMASAGNIHPSKMQSTPISSSSTTPKTTPTAITPITNSKSATKCIKENSNSPFSKTNGRKLNFSAIPSPEKYSPKSQQSQPQPRPRPRPRPQHNHDHNNNHNHNHNHNQNSSCSTSFSTPPKYSYDGSYKKTYYSNSVDSYSPLNRSLNTSTTSYNGSLPAYSPLRTTKMCHGSPTFTGNSIEGYLVLKVINSSSVNIDWKTYWGVQRGQQLFFYPFKETPNKNAAKSNNNVPTIVDIQGATIEIMEKARKTFFISTSDNKQFQIQTATQDELEKWVSALTQFTGLVDAKHFSENEASIKSSRFLVRISDISKNTKENIWINDD